MGIIPFDIQGVLDGNKKASPKTSKQGKEKSNPPLGSDASIKKRAKMISDLSDGQEEDEEENERENTKVQEGERLASFNDELRMRKLASVIKIVHQFTGDR